MLYRAHVVYLVFEVEWYASRQRQLDTSQMSAKTRVMQHRPTVVIRRVYVSLVLVKIRVKAYTNKQVSRRHA